MKAVFSLTPDESLATTPRLDRLDPYGLDTRRDVQTRMARASPYHGALGSVANANAMVGGFVPR
jgi:hypothetical protein